MMRASDELVFLLDCDNTLLDNDRAGEDFRVRLDRRRGRAKHHAAIGTCAG